ncbi:MAG TPA: efflux RND transporter periplasmic adaptor subunit [Alphaproteobacteria bacterium]
MKAFKILIILAILSGAGWYGWHKLHGSAEVAAPGAGMPQGPMPVKIMTLKAEPAQQWLEFSGTLVAVDTVEVRPRVNGAIQKIYFNPGDIVEKDEPLFLIDPRPYQAELDRAKAAQAAAQAQSVLSGTELDRAQRLIGENAISQRDLDERKNTQRVAEANKQSAAAAVQQASLNLQYATIRAPVRGKISRAEITVGNLVSPTTEKTLATIVSIDSIYADFDVDEHTYVKMIRQQAQAEGDSALPVQLVLNTDDSVVYDGKIVSFDNKLDSASGTIRARAIFANKDKALVPGMFAKTRLGQTEMANMILVPDRLISTDQDKKYVYTVSADNKIVYTPVILGGTADNKRIVLEGLKDGDKIVTEGLQRLRPDTLVQPMEEQPAPEADEAVAPADIVEPITVEETPAAPVDEQAEDMIPDDVAPVEAPKAKEEPVETPKAPAVDAKVEKPAAPVVKNEAMPAPKTLGAISEDIKKENAAAGSH